MFDLDFDDNDYYYDFEYNTKSELDYVLEDAQLWEQAQKQFEDYYTELLKRSGQNDRT